MSKVISLRFHDPQVERLSRLARRLNRTPSETAAMLVEEALRVAEYAYITFRTTAAGRHAAIAGTGLTVWEITSMARDYGGDANRIAEDLEIPPVLVQAALNYAADFPDEINAVIEDNDSYDVERLTRMFPNLRVIDVDSCMR